MLADVVKGFDGVVFLANHQNLFGADFFHLPVTGLRDLSFSAKEQPNLRPHAFPFFLEEIPRRVAVTWETRVPCRLIRPRFDFDYF